MGARGSLGADGVEALGEAVGAATDVEAAGEDAFGGYAAFRALLHGLPDGEDAFLDLLMKWEIDVGIGRKPGALYAR